ncbi:SDR family NAD(P)-dependent oxidoreductase [Caulobacter sp. KR2-114]|uniref:SDR family NAD(P)-dependent oxidoreductase n=1 Tax=Caulobacter sp. KR2-114 TaxID=3400912 RepID=UPI003C029766
MPHRKLALITGASAGMGAAFARAYAARGLDVALVARRADRLEALAAEMRTSHGVEALVIPADLSLYGVESVVLQAIADQGRSVDVLVNNAGFSIPRSFAAVPWEEQRDFLMTLVVSACGLAHGVIGPMAARGEGSIITVASLAGFAPGAAGHSLYPGAKSLAIKFTQALDAEYRRAGIRVTALCPGFVKTEFAAANGTQALMDDSPRLFFQTAEAVVETAIAANARGKVVVVPGLHNKIAAILLRYLPEPWVSAAVRAGSAKYHLEP